MFCKLKDPRSTGTSGPVEYCFLNSFQVADLTVQVKVAQSGPTLCDPMDYAVQGIL